MKSLTLTVPLLALLGAATASFVACGADTSNGAANGGTSGSAGKSSTSGAAGSGAGNGGSSSGAPGDLTCPSADCGPALGLPSTTCADGSVGGPTGRCLRLETAGCVWEVRNCPPAGEGGATGVGGTLASGGAASGGAASAGAGDGGAAGGGGTLSTDRCGGCNYNGIAPQICIYQAGGPGAGRFVCATQNPCGAAGECVCIVGQGACSPTLTLEAGGPYCVCDNGLD